MCAEHKKAAKLQKHLERIRQAAQGMRNPPRILIFANRCAGVGWGGTAGLEAAIQHTLHSLHLHPSLAGLPLFQAAQAHCPPGPPWPGPPANLTLLSSNPFPPLPQLDHRSIKTVRFLHKLVEEAGFRAALLHGERSQEEREAAVADFRSGKAQVRWWCACGGLWVGRALDEEGCFTLHLAPQPSRGWVISRIHCLTPAAPLSFPT